MIFEVITEMEIVTVLDRGVPNRESIALKVLEIVDTGQFGMLVGIARDDGLAVPINDHFFWLGGAVLNPGDWIFINTGDGEATVTEAKDKVSKTYSVYWKKPKTLFADSRVVPILMKIGNVDVLEKPRDRAQTKAISSS